MNRSERLKKILNNSSMVFILLVLMAFFTIAEPAFINPSNIVTIIKQVSVIGIATMGMSVLMIMQAIDLSAGSVVGFCCVLTAFVSRDVTLPLIVPILAGVAAGLLFGLLNGVVVAKGGIPPFIATLGTMTIARGLAMVISKGKVVDNVSDNYGLIGVGSLFGIKYLPYLMLCFALVVVAVSFMMKKRPFGRYIYAIGGNEQAAVVAGIKVDNMKLKAYGLMGLLTGFSGAMLTAWIKAGPPLSAGLNYELDAIAACVIGGISTTGGVGSCLGAVVGILIIGCINNGLDILNVPSYYQQIIKGIIIVTAVLIDSKRSKRG